MSEGMLYGWVCVSSDVGERWLGRSLALALWARERKSERISGAWGLVPIRGSDGRSGGEFGPESISSFVSTMS